MKGILTELSTTNVSRINEKNFHQVPEISLIPRLLHEYGSTEEFQSCLCLSRYVIQI
jgi:hypothetical protein